MPTYQYACTACAERTEAVQSFSDTPLTTCAACGGLLRKVFSAVGVVFKGSGFYKTDSRSAAKSDSTKSDSAKSADAPAKSDKPGAPSDKPAAPKSEPSKATSSASSPAA